MRRKYKNLALWKLTAMWERFDSIRTTETHGDHKLLQNNHVSLTIPALWTHRDAVKMIAKESQRPIAIQSLANDLSHSKFTRGKAISGSACHEIDKITANYEDMYWWISKDGLNIAVVSPAVLVLSEFDSLAGKLTVDGFIDHKLPKNTLVAIAKELDAAGFSLKELQREKRKEVSRYNQKYSKRAIKTFEQACRHHAFVRSVRRRLYVARTKYLKANPPAKPFPNVS